MCVCLSRFTWGEGSSVPGREGWRLWCWHSLTHTETAGGDNLCKLWWGPHLWSAAQRKTKCEGGGSSTVNAITYQHFLCSLTGKSNFCPLHFSFYILPEKTLEEIDRGRGCKKTDWAKARKWTVTKRRKSWDKMRQRVPAVWDKMMEEKEGEC